MSNRQGFQNRAWPNVLPLHAEQSSEDGTHLLTMQARLSMGTYLQAGQDKGTHGIPKSVPVQGRSDGRAVAEIDCPVTGNVQIIGVANTRGGRQRRVSGDLIG